MILYYVRVQSSDRCDAYVIRGADGLPAWTWNKPVPLSLGEAEILRRDAARITGGTLKLEESRND
jgi:hypothetical protein